MSYKNFIMIFAGIILIFYEKGIIPEILPLLIFIGAADGPTSIIVAGKFA